MLEVSKKKMVKMMQNCQTARIPRRRVWREECEMALTSEGVGDGDVGGGLGGVVAVGGLGGPGGDLVQDVREGILVGVGHVLRVDPTLKTYN